MSPFFRIKCLPLITAIALISVALLGGIAAADPTPLFCQRLLNPTVDSAAELEIPMSPQLMELLTTAGGDVRSLFNGISLPKHKTVTEQLLDSPWSALSYDMKLRLLQEASKIRNQDFHYDRNLHNMKVKDQVSLTFSKRTSFLGMTYEPGAYLIEVKQVLGGKLEYRGPNDMPDVSGLELHFRSRQTSGETSNDAWTLLEGSNIPRNHQHVHIVASLPVAEMKAEPRVQAALMSDFFRRANLFAEIMDIVEKGTPITKIAHDGLVYFSSLTQGMLWGVTKYFYNVGMGKNPPIDDRFKMAWVGMRGSDKYDTPGLWGLEYRSITADYDPVRVRKLLDALQWSMNKNSYGIGADQIRNWLNSFPPDANIASLMAARWYNDSWPSLFENAPPAVQKKLGWKSLRPLREKQLLRQIGTYTEAKMLLFDWSRDPLVFDNPELANKIAEEQANAIGKLQWGYDPKPVIRNFLINSGLYHIVANSLAVEIDSQYH